MCGAQCGPVLPEELVVEILSWVPVKALMRFRCVSKSWNSLVFDPSLIKLHLQRSTKNTRILLTFKDTSENNICLAPCSIRCLLESPSSTVDDCCHRFTHKSIVGVCNGLVCLRDYCDGDEFKEYWVRFWNPATRFMSQDSPRLRVNQYSHYYAKFGFGYDDSSDTYKVVALFLDYKLHILEVKIHRLGDTCWRNISTCPAFFVPPQIYGNFVSGTVNWLAVRLSSSSYQWKTAPIIFSYDLRDQTYRCLSTPDDLAPPYYVELGLLRGCLCISHERQTYFVVWLMREFGVKKSWSQLLKVRYEHLTFQPVLHVPLSLVSLIPLWISESGDVLMLGNYNPSKAVLYNLRANTINRTEDLNDKHCLYSYDYSQSLVLPYQN
ncbi:F-box/kelch-repeat protein [Spatholobus suberectus]|nr:F-box/kelch-repeat protein [Spatholobus suberectus]